MSYQVEITPAAQRQIKKLPLDVQQRIIERLEALAVEPRPPRVVKLEGEESLYRVRVGDYRIVYKIEDDILLILIVKDRTPKKCLQMIEFSDRMSQQCRAIVLEQSQAQRAIEIYHQVWQSLEAIAPI